jgi:hypothetical protein
MHRNFQIYVICKRELTQVEQLSLQTCVNKHGKKLRTSKMFAGVRTAYTPRSSEVYIKALRVYKHVTANPTSISLFHKSY